MFGLESMRILSGGVLAGTFVGVSVLGWIVARGRRLRGRIVAARSQRTGAEPLWAIGSIAVQAWALGALLFPSYFTAWPAVPGFPGDTLVQVVGLVAWAAGLVLVDTSAWILGRFLFSAAQVRDDHRLVQDGAYRWIRHPMYTANVAMAFGLGAFFLSPPLILVACALAGLAIYRARVEEDLLRSPGAFGRAYDAYMVRTGRFLPRIRKS